jgi:hypothetical protein
MTGNRIILGCLITVLGLAISAKATTMVLSANSDGNLTGTTLNSDPPGSDGLVVNVFSSTQAVIDFKLSSIPTGASITSVSFSFDETAEANSNGLVSINGYGRTGSIGSADAGASATLYGTYSSVTLGLGNHSVALNSAADTGVQSLLGTSQDLGIRLTEDASDTNTSLGSIEESPGFTAPTLSVSYSVPEPVSLGVVGILGFGLLTGRTRRAAI